MKKNTKSIVIASIFAISAFIVTPAVYTSGTFANTDIEQPHGYSVDREMLGSVEIEQPYGYNRDPEMLGSVEIEQPYGYNRDRETLG